MNTKLISIVFICFLLQSTANVTENDDSKNQIYANLRQCVYNFNAEKTKSYKSLNELQLANFITVINLNEQEKLEEVIAQKKNEILTALQLSGGVLIRNALGCEKNFPNVFTMLFGKSFEFSTSKGDNTPRTNVFQNVFKASEVPKEFYLHQHNEDTFMKIFPGFVAFYCSYPPPEGEGATPLAKNEDILNFVPIEIIKKIPYSSLRFTRYIPSQNNMKIKEINRVFKLVFNTQSDMIPTLAKVFNTEDKMEIENFITLFFGFNPTNSKDYLKWDYEGNLEFCVEGEKTYPILANIIRAAQEETEKNDDDSWCKIIVDECRIEVSNEFKKATSLSGSFVSSLDKDDLNAINNALIANTYRFQWREGDLLILNNEKITHGREPFSMEGRKVLVSKGR